MPPELGMDAEALFSTLWGRLGATPGEAGPDAPSAEAPPQAPAAAPDAGPGAPPVTLLQPGGTVAFDVAGAAPSVVHAPTPDTGCPMAPVYRRRRSLSVGSRSLRHRRRSGFRRGFPGRVQFLQPPPRFCYAACAGPP